MARTTISLGSVGNASVTYRILNPNHCSGGTSMFSRLAAVFGRRRKHLDKRRARGRKPRVELIRFRPAVESLEVRALMASVPVSVLHTFATPTNTDLTITHSSSTNLLT